MNAFSLIKGILTGDEFNDISKQFGTLLSMKNESKYQQDLMNGMDAEKTTKCV